MPRALRHAVPCSAAISHLNLSVRGALEGRHEYQFPVRCMCPWCARARRQIKGSVACSTCSSSGNARHQSRWQMLATLVLGPVVFLRVSGFLDSWAFCQEARAVAGARSAQAVRRRRFDTQLVHISRDLLLRARLRC